MAFRIEKFTSKENQLVQLPKVPPHEHALSALSLSYDEVLEILDKELHKNGLYKKAWLKAESIFEANPSKYRHQGMTQIPDECHIAIIAYTLEVSIGGKTLYSHFNSKCRDLKGDHDSWSSFPYKSFYWLLAHSLHGVRNKPSLHQKSYRGVNFHYSKHSFSRDRPVFFNQFTSCSTDPSVAHSFKGRVGTIIEFPANVMAAIGISNYSRFGESEILIFPWSTFRVKRMEMKGSVHKIVLENTKHRKFHLQAEFFADLVEENVSSASENEDSEEEDYDSEDSDSEDSESEDSDSEDSDSEDSDSEDSDSEDSDSEDSDSEDSDSDSDSEDDYYDDY